MRHLTALEKRRITGSDNALTQLEVFSSLGIDATARNPTGHHVIECVVYTTDVKAKLNKLEWSVIRDENIETGLANGRIIDFERRNKANHTQQHSGTAAVLGLADARRKKAERR